MRFGLPERTLQPSPLLVECRERLGVIAPSHLQLLAQRFGFLPRPVHFLVRAVFDGTEMRVIALALLDRGGLEG